MIFTFSRLFGCAKKDKKFYTPPDVVGLHYSCSSMNHSNSFVFSLTKVIGEAWEFEASYTDSGSNETFELKKCTINQNDIPRFFKSEDMQKLISAAQKYKPPKIKVILCDEDEYNLSFDMSDSSHLNAPVFSSELKSTFFDLAKKHCFSE